jgi:hypothetical protein
VDVPSASGQPTRPAPALRSARAGIEHIELEPWPTDGDGAPSIQFRLACGLLVAGATLVAVSVVVLLWLLGH